MREDVAHIAGVINKKLQDLKDHWYELDDRLELERNKGKRIALIDLQKVLEVPYPEEFGKRTTSKKEK